MYEKEREKKPINEEGDTKLADLSVSMMKKFHELGDISYYFIDSSWI